MRKGTRHTEETIAKLRAAQLGKCLSPEHCAKISTSLSNPNDIPCTTYAVAAGWTVIRIRECEINKENFSKLAVIK